MEFTPTSSFDLNVVVPDVAPIEIDDAWPKADTVVAVVSINLYVDWFVINSRELWATVLLNVVIPVRFKLFASLTSPVKSVVPITDKFSSISTSEPKVDTPEALNCVTVTRSVCAVTPVPMLIWFPVPSRVIEDDPTVRTPTILVSPRT